MDATENVLDRDMTVMSPKGIRPQQPTNASFTKEVTGETVLSILPTEIPGETPADRDARGQLVVGKTGIQIFHTALAKLAKV